VAATGVSVPGAASGAAPGGGGACPCAGAVPCAGKPLLLLVACLPLSLPQHLLLLLLVAVPLAPGTPAGTDGGRRAAAGALCANGEGPCPLPSEGLKTAPQGSQQPVTVTWAVPVT